MFVLKMQTGTNLIRKQESVFSLAMEQIIWDIAFGMIKIDERLLEAWMLHSMKM